jgi:hypothetical protein
LKDAAGIFGTFAAVTLAWVIFRAESLTQACDYLLGMLELSGQYPSSRMLVASAPIVLLILVDGVLRFQSHTAFVRSKFVRWALYVAASIAILLAWADESTQFIYFQF